jgi:hypothetical protein
LGEQVLREVIEVEKPKLIGHGGSAETDPIRYVLVGEAELIAEVAEGIGPLQRIQILALEVFDKCPLGGRLVVHLAHDRWQMGDPNELGRPPPPLADDQLEPPRLRSHSDRLHEAHGPHGRPEFPKRALIETLAWLAWVGPDL